ncbi:DUF1573 domain-containing protein [Labilibaculum sp.]|uniref:DUF1573 domain-containing protein n=1 Tax=Labilibaculum sp. TaxID=2060723 RepID=UPI0035679CE8
MKNRIVHVKIIWNIYKFVFFTILLGLIVQCTSNKSTKQNQQATREKVAKEIIPTKGFPKFEFSEEIHKFGEITEGEIVVCDFFFKNVGSKDLVINNIETSCGCTAVQWEKKPIRVGEESHLTVEFNSKGRYGIQYKVITIFSNTLTGSKELVITAQVN